MKESRNKYVKLLVVFLLGIYILPATAQKPNVILIVTDDQSFNSIAYSGGDVFTPCIDLLAGNGIKFTNGHHPTSTCSPSRYAILTGKFPGRCETDAFMADYPSGTQTRLENNVELAVGEANLGSILQENGYKTGFVGKSHITDHDILLKKNWANYGLQTYGQTDDPYNPAVSAKMKHNHDVYQEVIKSYGFDYADGIYMANVKELRNDALNVHNLEWTVDKARDFIEQEKDNPFFLYYSTTLHHGPVPWAKSNGKYWASFDADPKLTGEGYVDQSWDFMPTRQEIFNNNINKGFPEKTGYSLLLDEGVRAIYNQVVAMGIEDNTLIIFMPDHGMWRHGKATLYDYGTKVPMFMYWKGTITAGTSFPGLVQSIDFAPTILDVTGSTFEGESAFDGVSLKNIMETGTGAAHESLFAEFGYARSVKTEKWKYIAVRYPDDVQVQVDEGFTWRDFKGQPIDLPYLCANTHLGYYASENNPLYFQKDQLFNLETDAAETVNVYDQNPLVVAEMKVLLSDYIKDFDNRPFGEFAKNANSLPVRAGFPTPKSTSTKVISQDVELSWEDCAGATSFNVYFGTTATPSFIGNQTETTYNTGDLSPMTKYYWRVDAVNSTGITTGNLWSFTTETNQLVLNFEKYIYTDVVENEVRTQYFEVSNVKDAAVSVNNIRISGADASYFTVSEDLISGTQLAPNTTKTFTVTYKPETSGGNHSANVIIESALGNSRIDLIASSISDVYRKTIDNFDIIGAWTSNNSLRINNKAQREGGACLEMSGKETREFQVKYATPFTNQATVENAYLQFWYYVSDVEKYTSNNQVEIGSGGKNDTDEFNWNLNGRLQNGWNFLSLKFSEAGISPNDGNPSINAINHIRVFHGKTDAMTIRIDGLQIVESTIMAPEKATNPKPEDNTLDDNSPTNLTWDTGLRAASHLVHFGEQNPPLFIAEASGSSHDLPDLKPNTTYYWRIDEKNAVGTSSGDLWSFTTTDNVAGLQDEYSKKENFTLYPNPSAGTVQIVLAPGINNVSITVINMNGQTVLEKISKKRINNLELSHLSKGIYLVKVRDAIGVTTKKLILD
tara:strand:+ start:5055 stop:8264 length:3210 start_codon:yes stop_codon:yes gene_type:complete